MKRVFHMVEFFLFCVALVVAVTPAAGVARTPPAVAEAPSASPPDIRGAVGGWTLVVPVVGRARQSLRVSRAGASQQELVQLLTDLAGRTGFELQLPEPDMLDSRIVQVMWQDHRSAVVAVEVLYRIGGRTAGNGYWVAGQRQCETADPGWRGRADTIPVATRFWSYREAQGDLPGSENAPNQQQLYRFHDGVESWVAGPFASKAAAARAAAAFREVNRGGAAPIIVIGLGVVAVMIWPAYAAWAAKRRYEARRAEHMARTG